MNQIKNISTSFGDPNPQNYVALQTSYLPSRDIPSFFGNNGIDYNLTYTHANEEWYSKSALFYQRAFNELQCLEYSLLKNPLLPDFLELLRDIDEAEGFEMKINPVISSYHDPKYEVSTYLGEQNVISQHWIPYETILDKVFHVSSMLRPVFNYENQAFHFLFKKIKLGQCGNYLLLLQPNDKTYIGIDFNLLLQSIKEIENFQLYHPSAPLYRELQQIISTLSNTIKHTKPNAKLTSDESSDIQRSSGGQIQSTQVVETRKKARTQGSQTPITQGSTPVTQASTPYNTTPSTQDSTPTTRAYMTPGVVEKSKIFSAYKLPSHSAEGIQYQKYKSALARLPVPMGSKYPPFVSFPYQKTLGTNFPAFMDTDMSEGKPRKKVKSNNIRYPSFMNAKPAYLSSTQPLPQLQQSSVASTGNTVTPAAGTPIFGANTMNMTNNNLAPSTIPGTISNTYNISGLPNTIQAYQHTYSSSPFPTQGLPPDYLTTMANTANVSSGTGLPGTYVPGYNQFNQQSMYSQPYQSYPMNSSASLPPDYTASTYITSNYTPAYMTPEKSTKKTQSKTKTAKQSQQDMSKIGSTNLAYQQDILNMTPPSSSLGIVKSSSTSSTGYSPAVMAPSSTTTVAASNAISTGSSTTQKKGGRRSVERLSWQKAAEAADRARTLTHERMKRGNSTAGSRSLPEASLDILRGWLFDHFDKPYPNEQDKEELAAATGLTKSQVNYWMINARVRIWKPVVKSQNEKKKK